MRSPTAAPAVAGVALVVAALGGTERLLAAAMVGLYALFFTYFVRHLAFAIAAMGRGDRDREALFADTGFRPRVSVLVACKDEETVVDRLVGALLALDYPRDRLQIVLVNDGSTDATPERLDRWATLDSAITVVHREAAAGGKSAALNAGLTVATGDVVVVFDADHVPRPDVVRRLVRHFEDPGVGAVQGRCVIANPEDSLLANLVAIDYAAGYLVNEYGRQCLFQLPAYGGANCAVRASSVRAIGGWNEASVTEDTDLTLRLLLRGERLRYDVTAVDEEEGVVTLRRYWRQRYRWARGHQQVWRDYRGAVWRSSRLGVIEKIETLLFLATFHVPVASALGTLVLAVLLAGATPQPVTPVEAFVLWTLLFLGPLVELGAGLLLARADRREALRLPFFLPLFFVSMALCTKAWIDGTGRRHYSWDKTRRSGEPDPVEAGA